MINAGPIGPKEDITMKCQACGSELRTCGKCGWSKVYEEDMSEVRDEISEFQQEAKRWRGIAEQLRADNAALLECLENICACSTDDFVTSMYMVHEIQSLARECIAKLETKGR